MGVCEAIERRRSTGGDDLEGWLGSFFLCAGRCQAATAARPHAGNLARLRPPLPCSVAGCVRHKGRGRLNRTGGLHLALLRQRAQAQQQEECVSVRPGKKCGGLNGTASRQQPPPHAAHLCARGREAGERPRAGPQIRVGSENASLLPSHDERVLGGLLSWFSDVDGYDCDPGDLMDRARNELRDSSDNNGCFAALSFRWIMLVSVAFVFLFLR